MSQTLTFGGAFAIEAVPTAPPFSFTFGGDFEIQGDTPASTVLIRRDAAWIEKPIHHRVNDAWI